MPIPTETYLLDDLTTPQLRTLTRLIRSFSEEMVTRVGAKASGDKVLVAFDVWGAPLVNAVRDGVLPTEFLLFPKGIPETELRMPKQFRQEDRHAFLAALEKPTCAAWFELIQEGGVPDTVARYVTRYLRQAMGGQPPDHTALSQVRRILIPHVSHQLWALHWLHCMRYAVYGASDPSYVVLGGIRVGDDVLRVQISSYVGHPPLDQLADILNRQVLLKALYEKHATLEAVFRDAPDRLDF